MRCTAGLPFLLKKGMTVHFVPPRFDIPRQGIVTSAEIAASSDNLGEVFFDSVTDYNIAQELVGSYCLVEVDDDVAKLLAISDNGIVGFSVIDNAYGCLGSVVSVIENPAQKLLCVASQQNQELLIPYVDAIVLGIEVNEKRIITSIPDGLLDL